MSEKFLDSTFGEATLDDLAELVQLRLGYLAADFGELAADEAAVIAGEVERYLPQHLGRDLVVFVARVRAAGGEAIACCAWLLLVEKPPSPRFPHGRTGVLFNVYTAPEHRRRGFARGVMAELIAWARDHALDVLELHATDDGYPLYRGLGFEDDSSTHVAMRMMLG